MNQHTHSSPRPLAIWAAMLSIYIVWGSTYLAIRFVVQTGMPFLMAGFRFLLAGMILFVFRRLRGDPSPTRNQWRSAVIIGVFMLTFGNGGVSWAEQRVASGVASLLVGSAPLWMFLLDALSHRLWPKRNIAGVAGTGGSHRPGWLSILGVLVGFCGIVLLVGPSELTGLKGEIDFVGASVLTLGSFTWALGSLYSRSASLPVSPLLGTGMEMLGGGAGLMILGTLSGEWSRLNFVAISAQSWLGFGYLVIFGSLVGFASYTWLLRVAPTTLVSTYAYVNPIVAILVGNLLAQEPLTPRIVIATLVILSSVALITATQRVKGKTSTTLPIKPPALK
jgi:drug/metabolite transporter (DMT)-like permease